MSDPLNDSPVVCDRVQTCPRFRTPSGGQEEAISQGREHLRPRIRIACIRSVLSSRVLATRARRAPVSLPIGIRTILDFQAGFLWMCNRVRVSLVRFICRRNCGRDCEGIEGQVMRRDATSRTQPALKQSTLAFASNSRVPTWNELGCLMTIMPLINALSLGARWMMNSEAMVYSIRRHIRQSVRRSWSWEVRT